MKMQTEFNGIINKDNDNEWYAGILFLILPIVSFIFSIKHFGEKKYNKYVFLFCIFYGLSYIPIPNSDATRYAARVKVMEPYTFSKYIDEISNMYAADAENNDAYVHTVFLILTPITNNIIFYRLFFAIVYFSVYLALIKELYASRILDKEKKFNWFILGVIFVINLSSPMNGVRFPLAMMVFLLGYFKYIKLKKTKYILLAVSSFLIHFSLSYLAIFLLIYILTRKIYKPITALVLLLATFAFSVTIGNTVISSSGVLGEGIGNKATSYTENETYKEIREAHLEKVNWYINFNRFSTNYFVLISIVLCAYFGINLQKSNFVINLEYFAILMFIASFISGQFVDVLSNRFYLTANASGLIYLFCLYEENRSSEMLNKIRTFYIPIVILHVLIMLRGDLSTISPNLLFGNIFTEILFSFDVSVQDILPI